MDNMSKFSGVNFNFKPDTVNFTLPTTPTTMKTSKWVVLMHCPGVGTYAPSFPTIDEAEEFSNAMRVVTDDVAISEPIPVVKTETIKETKDNQLPSQWIATN